MTRLRRHPAARSTELEGEAFLVRPDSDIILRLNATGAALWRALEEPAGRDELVGLFAAAFPGIPRNRLAADLDDALTALRGADMVIADE